MTAPAHVCDALCTPIGRHARSVLAHLQETTGDPRYRPARWLRRRALLGLALRAPTTHGAG
jgi:hypothetical protein